MDAKTPIKRSEIRVHLCLHLHLRQVQVSLVNPNFKTLSKNLPPSLDIYAGSSRLRVPISKSYSLTSMKSSARGVFLLLSILLASCGTAPAATPAGLPFILITAAPNASPTPTPFQPPLAGQVTPTSLYYIEVPTLEPFFPTSTPSPTPTPPPQPTATVDLNSLFPTAAAPPLPETPVEGPTPLPPLTDNETVNFLLIGSDRRSGTSFRTDTMVMVVLWPKEGQASMISIPRDLWVYIPSVGMQRVNTAYENGEFNGYHSIWSVTRIVPISAAMAAPIRPATMSEAITGPSSRVTDSTTTVATAPSAEKRLKPVCVCSASTT